MWACQLLIKKNFCALFSCVRLTPYNIYTHLIRKMTLNKTELRNFSINENDCGHCTECDGYMYMYA